MRILVDMNLSPEWSRMFEKEGFESTPWIDVGNPTASDKEILNYARENHFIILLMIWILGIFLPLQGSTVPV